MPTNSDIAMCENFLPFKKTDFECINPYVHSFHQSVNLQCQD